MARARRRELLEPIFVTVINSDISNEILDKLFSNIRYNINGCWLRGNDSTVYTTVTINGKPTNAARVSYEVCTGKKLKHWACHECDTPACINPDHIFDGTVKDNNQDARRKRRAFTPSLNSLLSQAKQYARDKTAKYRQDLIDEWRKK